MKCKIIKNCKIPSYFLIFVFLGTILLPTVIGIDDIQLKEDREQIETNHPLDEKKDWTIMIYLDGDNDVEGMAIDLQFTEFAEVGSTDDVNIIVEFDRIPGYSSRYGDWTTTKRYYIEKNMEPTSENAIMDLGEVNMGDPETIVDFATWAINNYPAEKYCLIFCGHGYGWKGGTCPDITDDDILEISEISSAINKITENGSNKIDLIGFDGCKMQMIEIGYELSRYVTYIIGSEAAEIWGGWNYRSPLLALINNPDITIEELGELFISSFILNGGKTLSIINLTNIQDLTNNLDDLASSLQNSEYRQQIDEALSEVENYYENDILFSRNYVDLFHLIQLLNNKINDDEINNIANQIMESFETVILSSENNDDYQHAHGLSIYGPYFKYDQDYNELLFSKETLWDDILRWFYYANTPEKPTITGPSEGKIRTEYTYHATSYDIDDHKIYYLFDWGDGTNSGWLGPFISGETCETIHQWDTADNYSIKVKTKDEKNLESQWSDELSITMSRAKNQNFKQTLSLLRILIDAYFILQKNIAKN